MRPQVDTVVTFTFDTTAPLSEVEGTLELSRLATAILHGLERVELEAPCAIDRDQRLITIGTGTDAGRTLSAIFLGSGEARLRTSDRLPGVPSLDGA